MVGAEDILGFLCCGAVYLLLVVVMSEVLYRMYAGPDEEE